MLRSIGKQSGGIRGVNPKEERKATAGRICRKGRFRAWNERLMDDGSGESMELMEVVPFIRLGEPEL